MAVRRHVNVPVSGMPPRRPQCAQRTAETPLQLQIQSKSKTIGLKERLETKLLSLIWPLSDQFTLGCLDQQLHVCVCVCVCVCVGEWVSEWVSE